MKILKKILIALLVLLLLLLLIAFFIPKTYIVSVSTTINKPKTEVFNYVKIIKNEAKYSFWILQDPNVVMTYKNQDSKVGFITMWNNPVDNNNEGEQEVAKIIEGERIEMDLRFKKPMPGNQKSAYIFKSISDNQTQVTAEFYGNSPYPMNLLSLIGKSIINDAQTKTLQNLKTILEK
jgi:hypothetical protein